MAGKLTVAQVKALDIGRYGDGGGLWLDVRAGQEEALRGWFFRFRSPTSGKDRWMSLGAFPGVSLADARGDRDSAKALLRKGIDPIDERNRLDAEAKARQATVANSQRVLYPFSEVAALCIKAREANWRNPKHGQQWSNTLEKYAMPTIGAVAIAELSTEHLLKVLEPIWYKRTETASRVRNRIELVIDYARARGWFKGENPARWRGHLKNLLAEPEKVAPVKNFAALPYQQVGAFMRELRTMPGVAARALELAILTAARSGEVRLAAWGEFDLDEGIWAVPGARMKAGKEHRVPLSQPALILLTTLRPDEAKPNDLVFPSPLKAGRPLSDMTLTAVLKRAEVKATVHGFRACFKTWASETTAHPREIVEKALAHAVGNQVENAYQRGDLLERRRVLMADWASYCDTPQLPATVTTMRPRALSA